MRVRAGDWTKCDPPGRTAQPSYFDCISVAALNSAMKSAPVSIEESIWRNAVYMMARRRRPENSPGRAFSVYLSSGSLMSSPLRPSIAITDSVAYGFSGPSYLKGSKTQVEAICNFTDLASIDFILLHAWQAAVLQPIGGLLSHEFVEAHEAGQRAVQTKTVKDLA